MPMLSIDIRMIHHSGIGTYLRNIVPRVIASHPNIQFSLLGDSTQLHQYDWSHSKNVHIIHYTTPIYSIAEQVTLLQKIPMETTLLWSPHYNVPLLYKGRLLVTIYDLFPLAMPTMVGGYHKYLYAKAMFNAVRQKASTIITISHFTKKELIRLTRAGLQEIVPIHLGVEDLWFNLKKGNNPHDKPFLLYVGNVKPHKNLIALVKAFGLLIHKIPHDLVIIGKKEGFITGDTRVALEAASLGNRVQFTGYVEEWVLHQYVAHADMLVLPSLYEGFGLPPLEAMAAGCPVIVSNTASLPEVCGDAALYCDLYRHEDIADKILSLCNDRVLSETLRSRGVEHAKQFTWEKCVKETNRVIDELL